MGGALLTHPDARRTVRAVVRLKCHREKGACDTTPDACANRVAMRMCTYGYYRIVHAAEEVPLE